MYEMTTDTYRTLDMAIRAVFKAAWVNKAERPFLLDAVTRVNQHLYELEGQGEILIRVLHQVVQMVSEIGTNDFEVPEEVLDPLLRNLTYEPLVALG